ncbi:hypothetical protein [Nocardioides panacisoli]|uniref:Type IV toxin-antitoxin system AbiEi family antitoxin domain-containing protein n=1 Tax=Nocardioides panacisoli TaxID=627624 RepID=A0ABP7J1U8_9ACTN
MQIQDYSGHPLLDPLDALPADRPFTTAEALAAGLTYDQLRVLIAKGALRHPIRGVYVAARVPDSIALRCQCLRLVVPEDAVVVDRHAGWLHGAEMVLAPNEHIHLEPVRLFLPAGRGRLRNHLADSGERTFRTDDLMEIGGLRVTTPLRTALDLGRHRWPDRSLAAMDQMLRLKSFTKEELINGVERFRGARWVRTLRLMVEHVDGRAESPPESVMRLRWIETHLPYPTPQIEVWDGPDFLARLDLGNEESRYAAEYDGAEWHSSPEQRAHDRRRREVARERGEWVIDAFVKEDLWGPTAHIERRLREGAARAALRFGRRSA